MLREGVGWRKRAGGKGVEGNGRRRERSSAKRRGGKCRGMEEEEEEKRRGRAKEGEKGRKGGTETLTVHQACLWMLQVHLHPRAEQRKVL